MRQYWLWVVWCCAAAGAGCNAWQTTPDPIFTVSAQEQTVGRQAAEYYRQYYGVYPDEAFTRYLQAIGDRLIARLPRTNLVFKVAILDSDEPNALSFSSGDILLTRGMLTLLNDEDEAAYLLAHEIAHVMKQHGAKQRQEEHRLYAMSRAIGNKIGTRQGENTVLTFGYALSKGYSRQQETEADIQAIDYLANAKYDVQAGLRLMQTLDRLWNLEREAEPTREQYAVFHEHPITRDRIVAVQKVLSREIHSPRARQRAAYLERLEGMAVSLIGGRAHHIRLRVFADNVEYQRYRHNYLDDPRQRRMFDLLNGLDEPARPTFPMHLKTLLPSPMPERKPASSPADR